MELGQGIILIILGFFLLTGYVAHIASDKFSIPGVTILLFLGAALNPSFLNIIPEEASHWFPFVSHIALAMIGFLLGESFVAEKIKNEGLIVFWISVGKTVLTILIVFLTLMAFGVNLQFALILAGIAPASAPAAIYETVKESKAKGKLSDTVLGVVAIDDAWGVLSFSILFVIAKGLSSETNGFEQLASNLWELGGAVLIGSIIGLPMTLITDKIRDGEMTLIEAMGFVLLCSGLAIYLKVSYLLACMVLGTVVANFSKNRSKPFHEIEKIREPFLAIFFILSGFKLELHTLTAMGLIGVTYVGARTLGFLLGSYLTGKIIKAPAIINKHIGWCMLPQAGVALGFALLVHDRMPELGSTVLNLVIATTIIFEITGPLLAKWQLKRVGEAGD
ncbi:MAG: cation:proton antiporter [Fidelibacterota bacterium]